MGKQINLEDVTKSAGSGPWDEWHDVERHADISGNEFRRKCLHPPRPVVLTNAAASWPAMEKWSIRWFAEKYGDRELIMDSEPHSVREFVDWVFNSTPENPAPYMRNRPIGEEFPELMPDLSPHLEHSQPNRAWSKLLPASYNDAADHYFELFIGGAGRSFPLVHCDLPPMHTWSILIEGVKEWILFPPGSGEHLYEDPDREFWSSVPNVFGASLDEYPDLGKLKPYRCLQQAGETVFVPEGWWHTARMHAPSMTVACDQLCASNWRGYSKWRVEGHKRVGGARAAAAQAYLWTCDKLLRTSEFMQGYRGQ